MIHNREPIFWTSTTPGYNDEDRQRRVMVAGKPAMERFPQHGHVGDYDAKTRAPGQRAVMMVRHDGHTVLIVLTCGAAHLDPNTGWGQQQLAKARTLGWFAPGQCPLALVLTGRLTREHFADQSLLADRACEPGKHSNKNPCPHAIAERNARAAQHKELEAERLASFETSDQKLLAAQREQTRALVNALTRGNEPRPFDEFIDGPMSDGNGGQLEATPPQPAPKGNKKP